MACVQPTPVLRQSRRPPSGHRFSPDYYEQGGLASIREIAAHRKGTCPNDAALARDGALGLLLLVEIVRWLLLATGLVTRPYPHPPYNVKC